MTQLFFIGLFIVFVVAPVIACSRIILKPAPVYTYFVSYKYYTKYKDGFGNCFIERPTKVKTVADTRGIQSSILADRPDFESALILHFTEV